MCIVNNFIFRESRFMSYNRHVQSKEPNVFLYWTKSIYADYKKNVLGQQKLFCITILFDPTIFISCDWVQRATKKRACFPCWVHCSPGSSDTSINARMSTSLEWGPCSSGDLARVGTSFATRKVNTAKKLWSFEKSNCDC